MEFILEGAIQEKFNDLNVRYVGRDFQDQLILLNIDKKKDV